MQDENARMPEERDLHRWLHRSEVIHEECVCQYPNRTKNNLVMSLEGAARSHIHSIAVQLQVSPFTF